MPDRSRPISFGQRIAESERGGMNPARIAELLAQIGALGERIDADAQRCVAALRQAAGQPGVDYWDREMAKSLLDLAARIDARRRCLDDALERDRARLLGETDAAGEPGAEAQLAMDPVGPGMI